MRPALRRAAIIALLSYRQLAGVSALAQEQVSVHGSLLFYGDNTEFSAFRDGATLFGAAIRLYGAVEMSERVTVRLGATGNHRFGADRAFEFVRPLAALVMTHGPSTFVFGSLETTDVRQPSGPDRGGPHGLLPPIQRETLSYDRPYEAGLQWTFRSPRLAHETWINWQRVNTPSHRERFDAGLTTDWRAAAHVALRLQAHVVHEGGQLFALGAVADSYALAPGIAFLGGLGRNVRFGLEGYAVGSRFVPDRAAPDRRRSGAGMFLRAEAADANWRGHLIAWRGDDFITEEGDRNYLSLQLDGRRYRGIRDYSEIGLTRWVRPAADVTLELSARIYRIEPHNYEYSYRVLALTNFGWVAKKRTDK